MFLSNRSIVLRVALSLSLIAGLANPTVSAQQQERSRRERLDDLYPEAGQSPAEFLFWAEQVLASTKALHYYGSLTRTEIEPSATEPESFTVSGAVWMERLPEDKLLGWKLATLSSTAFGPEPFMIRATYDGTQVSLAYPTLSRLLTYEPTLGHISIVTDFQRGWILDPFIDLQQQGGNALNPLTQYLANAQKAVFKPDEPQDGTLCRVIEFIARPSEDPSRVSSSKTTYWIGKDGFLRRLEKDWVFGGTRFLEQRTYRGVVATGDLADELFVPWKGDDWEHVHTAADQGESVVSKAQLSAPTATSEDSRTTFAKPPAIGSKLPKIRLTMSNGKTVQVPTDGSGPFLLDFWGTWCAPCVMALPGIQRLHEEFEKRGLTVIGVSVRESSKANPAKFLKIRGCDYQTAVFGEEAAAQLGVSSFPTLILVDRNGLIHARWHGYSPDHLDEIRAKVETTLIGGD